MCRFFNIYYRGLIYVHVLHSGQRSTGATLRGARLRFFALFPGDRRGYHVSVAHAVFRRWVEVLAECFSLRGPMGHFHAA